MGLRARGRWFATRPWGAAGSRRVRGGVCVEGACGSAGVGPWCRCGVGPAIRGSNRGGNFVRVARTRGPARGRRGSASLEPASRMVASLHGHADWGETNVGTEGEAGSVRERPSCLRSASGGRSSARGAGRALRRISPALRRRVLMGYVGGCPSRPASRRGLAIATVCTALERAAGELGVK